MKIQDTTFDFKGLTQFQKIGVYLSIEWRHFLWLFRLNRSDKIFFEGNTIKNLRVYKWEKIFWIGRYTYACLEVSEEQRAYYKIKVQNHV